MAVVAGKMTMSMLQTVKGLFAVVPVSFQTPSEHTLADDIRAALKVHSEKIFGFKGYQFGLVDVWIWQSLATQIQSNSPPFTAEQADFLKK